GLAAGLLASAWSKRWLRALLGACILSIIFCLIFVRTAGEIVAQGMPIPPGLGYGRPSEWEWQTGLFIIGAPSEFLSFVTPPTGLLLRSIALITLLSVLGLLFALVLAGRKTQRVWQDEPASRLQL